MFQPRKVNKKDCNSFATTIPAEFMRTAGIEIGDLIRYSLNDGKVTIEKVQSEQLNQKKRRMTIENVFRVSSQRKITIPFDIVNALGIKDEDYLAFKIEGSCISFSLSI